MEHRIIKLAPLKILEVEDAQRKNYRLSTEPEYCSSKKTMKEKSFRPSCQINCISIFQKIPNEQKSSALKKINDFEKRISTLNQSFEKKRTQVTSR